MMKTKTSSSQSPLPPGFRFHPTDQELILHYLRKKIASSPLPVSIIAEVDIYKFDPWDLPAIATFGEKEWYFFTPRDRKYPNGARPNRAAASGYWKATGTDKTIVAPVGGGGGVQNVGVKKALVFYKGRPPKGTKTNWIMHEYRLAEALHRHGHYNLNSNKPKLKDLSMRLDDWVLCRIYKKCHASVPTSRDQEQEEEEEKLLQESLDLASHNMNSVFPQKSSSFSNLLDAMDYSLLSSFLSESTHLNLNPPGFNLEQPLPSSFFNNNNININTYFVDQKKLPDLITSSNPNINKRQNPSITHQETSNPSKRLNTNNHQFEHNNDDNSNNYLLKQTFLNQHLLMNPNYNIHFQ